MDYLYDWLGDLNDPKLGLGRELVGFISIIVSVFCGAIIGSERERREKPAGLRTLILISVGSTIFTMVSLLLSQLKPMADPARLAAQIIPGIGFLGAGAIIHARGTVFGLTTGATIWAVAAVGVTIGAGYVAAGISFMLLILITLDSLHRLEWLVVGRCSRRRAVVVYRAENGKTLPHIQEVLDMHAIPDAKTAHTDLAGDQRSVEFPVCMRHRHHRVMLRELADVPAVVSIQLGAPVDGGRSNEAE